jgi:hypothetical protein
MAGFAMRNHRVSADRRLAPQEGFGREEIIRAFSAGGRCRILVAATLSHRRRAGAAELETERYARRCVFDIARFARIEPHLGPWPELQKDYISTERS